MSTDFPTTLDDFTNPGATEVLGTAAGIGIAAEITNLNDAVEALEAKVGINSSAVTTSHDYILSTLVVKLAGTQTITGVKSFSATPKTDAIAEKTSAAGVTVDGLLIKDSQVQIPGGPWTTASDGATVTFDLAVSRNQIVTLGGNRTLALSNPATGMVFLLTLKQDGTGSRTVTWFAGITWAGGSAPTLTTTASKADTFGFICYGADTYYGFVVGQNI